MPNSCTAKLLIFHPANVFGGAERTLLNLLKHINRKRFWVVLVADSAVFHQPPVDVFIDLDQRGISNGYATARHTLRDARTLCALAREYNCSIVFGMLHYGAMVAALCGPLSGFALKTIASPRTPSVKGIQFHLGDRGWHVKKWHLWVHFFCRFADRVAVASEGLKQEAVAQYGAQPERVWVIPNSVDDAVISQAQAAADSLSYSGQINVITVCRLVSEKNLDTLLQACARIPPSLDLTLTIIGTGNQQSALYALAEHLNIANRVHFLGFKSNPFDYIKSADIFVHTALFEGFGNVILEAMACGVAVIATDCDFGPREIIGHGQNGLLCKPSDPDDLAKQLLILAENPELRRQLATTGLAHIEHFSAQRMAAGYQQLFLSLL